MQLHAGSGRVRSEYGSWCSVRRSYIYTRFFHTFEYLLTETNYDSSLFSFLLIKFSLSCSFPLFLFVPASQIPWKLDFRLYTASLFIGARD